MVEGLGTGLFVTVTNLAPHYCGCGEILPGKFFLITRRDWRRVLKLSEKTFSDRHNPIPTFAVKLNIVSEIIKVLLNDIFQNLMEAGSGIKNIMT